MAMLDARVVAHDDLHEGSTPWGYTAGDLNDKPTQTPPPARETEWRDLRCDVLIVGAGITGAFLAEHLAQGGRRVAILDREPPGCGSTAASTAMLQWEIDAPLVELADRYGFERAADIYRRSRVAVTSLADLVQARGFACEFRRRSTIYLGGAGIDAAEIAAEHGARRRAGLPGRLLTGDALARKHGFSREAAIVSPGSAEADPLKLTHALLHGAMARGARVLAGDALDYVPSTDGVGVVTAEGQTVEAGHVLLATGYALPDFIHSPLHRTVSSWAIATRPQPPKGLWPGRELVWEAAERYSYARTTTDGRIVFGGEDEEIVDPLERDALITTKARTLSRKLAELRPDADAEADLAWSGAFGETDDGLPLIGAVPGRPRILAAYGYGGNGITFSFMASRILAQLVLGRSRPWFEAFALDRA